jgi:hypothetical protein
VAKQRDSRLHIMFAINYSLSALIHCVVVFKSFPVNLYQSRTQTFSLGGGSDTEAICHWFNFKNYGTKIMS